MLRDVVLVVDQDAMMCNLASMILSRQGFEVVTAVNGRTAAELCRARKTDRRSGY